MGTMNFVDTEREIERRYVLCLRGIFEIDNIFVYNEDDTLTKVIITPEYPEKGSTFKTPHIVTTGISYSVNLHNSLSKNYYEDVVNTDGVIIGQRFVNIIPYSISLICLSEYFISKDLANRLASYISFVASEVFDYARLNIQSVTKGTTSAQQQYPEKIFETTVSVQGVLEWVGTKTTNVSAMDIIRKIKL